MGSKAEEVQKKMDNIFKRVRDLAKHNCLKLLKTSSDNTKEHGRGCFVVHVTQADDVNRNDWSVPFNFYHGRFLAENGFYSVTYLSERISKYDPEKQFVYCCTTGSIDGKYSNFCNTVTVSFRGQEESEKDREVREKSMNVMRESLSKYGEAGLKVCWWCGKSPKGLQRCTRCKFAHYCHTKCQSEDWNKHSVDCKGVSNMMREFREIAKKKGEDPDKINPDLIRRFLDGFTPKFESFPDAKVNYKDIRDGANDATSKLAEYLDNASISN